MIRRKRIPIGYEDFKEIIDDNMYYVDKTMLIYELLTDGGKNNLITRPRRFGKTLNLSMLRYFFDINEKENAYLFDGLRISEHYSELEEYRNAFPVITLSLKCGKQGDLNEAMKMLRYNIQQQFIDNKKVLDGDRVSEENKQEYRKILANDDGAMWGSSIQLLSRCMYQYYGKKSVILIDEYDVPLEDAYFSGYYDRMVTFIRSLFESALKTNPALEFSVITGCLRISKESIFTGLNNLETNSILSNTYSEFFGFVQDEVDELVDFYGLAEKKPDIKRWYDGYLFGKTEVYNPWSVLNQIKVWSKDRDAVVTSWWTNSSSNSIIKTLVEQTDDETKAEMEKLLAGESIETHLRETITYGDIADSNENIWSFLFFTGYLKMNGIVKSGEDTGDEDIYSLVIPNLEIRRCYITVIMDYFEKYRKAVNKDELYKLLLSGDADGFAGRITELLKRSISYYDNAEQFYHGLIAGLLSWNIYYKAVSNRETGSGRSDLILYQQDRFINAVILEFKVCRRNEEITDAARRALAQIDERGYDAEARELGYRNIIKYGIAFKNKLCCAVVETDRGGDK